MKILLGVPLHPIHGMRQQCIAAIDNLDFGGHSIDIVKINDNGISSSLEPFDQILHKYQRLRTTFLAGQYDALLTIEYDNIVPSDALIRLIAIDADVSHGLYCNRRKPFLWLASIETTLQRGISYARNEATAQAAWGNVIETQGIGLGCTLIRRHVMERIEFRRVQGHPCANDWFFALDCVESGFSMAHDCGCIVGHIMEDGHRVVWPTPQAPFYRIEGDEMLTATMIQSATGQQKYRCMTRLFVRADNAYYQPGEEIVLDDTAAIPLLESKAIIALPEEQKPANDDAVLESVNKRTTRKGESHATDN